MSFEPKTGAFPGKIREVTLGIGAKAITLGGQSALPFYAFDAPAPHPQRIGLELSDRFSGWQTPQLKQFYADCTTMAQLAQKAQTLEGVSFLALHFEAADPNGENRPVEDCVCDALAVSAVTELPLVILGCQNVEKDEALFSAMASALRGKNVLLFSAREENYRTLAPAAREGGHPLGAETADDMNLAKQLNIMLREAGIAPEQTVLNVGTAAVGYGYEYAASTLDRIRLAALAQGDEDLQMPILAPVSPDSWAVKESTADENEEPGWGSREERAIQMEIATAAADLCGGADGVILRHPAAVAAIARMISDLN